MMFDPCGDFGFFLKKGRRERNFFKNKNMDILQLQKVFLGKPQPTQRVHT